MCQFYFGSPWAATPTFLELSNFPTRLGGRFHFFKEFGQSQFVLLFFPIQKDLYYILRYNNLRPQHGSLFFLLISKICFLKMLVCVCTVSRVTAFSIFFPPLFLFLSFLLYYNIPKFARVFFGIADFFK